jgi:hypothetical protein
VQFVLWKRYNVLSKDPEARRKPSDHYVGYVVDVARCTALLLVEFNVVQFFVEL